MRHDVVSRTLAAVLLPLALLAGQGDAVLLRSGDLGITRCVLQGRMQDKPALLYVFLSACTAGGGYSSRRGPTHLRVSGLFFMHDPTKPIRTTQLQQLDETENWTEGKDAIVLRSPHTGQEWPLSLQLAGPWSNPHRHRYPGRLSATLSDLSAVDSRLLEFHLTAQPGFHTFCTFLAGTARSPPWPAAAPQAAADAGSSEVGEGGQEQLLLLGRSAGWGPQRCAWLDEDGEEVEDSSSSSSSGSSSVVTSYMVVSPFFGLPASEYVSLLQHHMRYHAALGVRRYLVYLEVGASALAADPRVQALVAAGRLRLVMWEELPHFFEEESQVRHPYAAQSLVYNHALLALWAERAVAAIADVDEYLITPAKTTLQQVLKYCAEEDKQPAVSMQLLRRVGYCTGCCDALSGGGSGSSGSGVSRSAAQKLDRPALTAAHELERALWLNTSVIVASEAGVLAAAAAAGFPATGDRGGDGGDGGGGGALPHPLALYGVSTGDAEPKSVVLAHKVAFANPHITYPLPGERGSGASVRCAYWLHLRSQMALRLPHGKFTDVRDIKRPSLWVLDELEET